VIMMILTCIVLLVLGIWGIFNPFVGLLGLLGTNIIQPGELYPALGSLHVERVFAIIVVLSFLAHGRRFVLHPPCKSLLVFWTTLLVGVPLAFWKGGAFSNWVDFGRSVVYALLIATLVDSPALFKKFLVAFCVFITWLAASSFVLYMSGAYQVRMGIERAVGMTSNSDDANALGITLVTALPLLFLLVASVRGKFRLLVIAMTGICAYTVILTGSRASFFSLLSVGLVFVVTRRHRVAYLLVALILGALLWVAIPQQYKARYETVSDLQSDESYQARVDAWKAAWRMFLDHPLTGVGAGNFPVARGIGSGHWLNVHSLYMQLLSETGILGTLGFAAYLFSLFAQNLRLRRQLRDWQEAPPWLRDYPLAVNLSLLGLLVAGYTAHTMFRETWYLLGGMSAAAGLILSKHLQESQSEALAEPALGLHGPFSLSRGKA